MLLSYNRLKRYVDLPEDISQLEADLTTIGIEVDETIDYKKKYDKFVIAEVKSKESHPNADKLSLCVADYGTAQNKVVCGAPNVAAGQKVVLALEGALIPDGGFAIQPIKIRGQESNGMICSQKELDLGADASGIWVLPEDASPGTSLADYLELDDVILEVSITPNRSDWLSHYGVARDLAAFWGKEARLPEIKVEESGDPVEDFVSVEIQDSDKCPRYAARVVSNVKIGESPNELKKELAALGLRPLNCAVDVANFVMLELGHPLHAFDLDTVAGGKIIVKTAENNEKFTTLDGKERKLDDDMLMICDAEKSVAIGGVMGGENSEITDQTTNILIESAYFKPQSIRRTAKKLAIQSDASYRFERGADPDNVVRALDRAAQTIAELTGGEVARGVVDEYPKTVEKAEIKLRFARARALLGIDASDELMKVYLSRLGFEKIDEDAESITVRAPGYRLDCELEADLIEEIARLYDYGKIEPQSRVSVDYEREALPKKLRVPPIKKKISKYLVPKGFFETITQNITDPKSAKRFDENPIEIANPLGEELSVMRTSLIPHAVGVISRNLRVGEKNIAFFEIGKTFRKVGDEAETFIKNVEEIEELTISLCGFVGGANWASPERPIDFYDIKGAVEDLFDFLHIDGIKFENDGDTESAFSANNVAIVFHKQKIGRLGELDPDFLKEFDVDRPAFLARIKLAPLYDETDKELKYEPISPYPPAYRDLAFVVSSDVESGKIHNELNQVGGKYLAESSIFDVYEGEKLGAGKKSVAFALKYSRPDRTLTDKDVDKSINKIISAIEKKFDAKLREF